MFTQDDITYMQHAIQQAELAAKNNEVPVGAILVHDNQIIGEGWNHPIGTHDPTAHAEIIALRAGASTLKNYRLLNTTLYVTLEPCIMCVGAIVHARVQRVIYGAPDPKTGAVASMFQLGDTNKFNHRVEYVGGLLAEECGELLRKFFRERR
jgi:tRNA(adenine34) deaminase